MGLFGTSNGSISNQITAQGQTNFKTMNNLLTLQENHVEEFFQYHGENFLSSFEKLLEDVIERVVSKMLTDLKFSTGSSGEITVHPDAMREYEKITAENIQLDLQSLLATALNSEVIVQRRMAKQQYLESQGFAVPQEQQQPQLPMGQPNMPSNIQGAPAMGGMNQQMMQQQMALNNGSGYPIPPSGYDQYNNPYWIDPATGQPTYNPPQSGLGLAAGLGKAVAWAKWLA